MSKLNQSGRHDKRQAQKLRLELQQAKQLIKKLHIDQEVMLACLALLVLLVACYAESLCQQWSPDMMPCGTFGGVICLDMGIDTLSAEIPGSW